MSSFYSWMVRLLLPLSLGVLATTLATVWPDSRHMGWMDVTGSAALLLAMIGVALWTFSAWVGD